MVAYIGVDVGCTFTDFAVTLPDAGREIFHKVPSTPGESNRAIIEGLRQILARGDVGPDAVVVIETPGAGGYGPPAERSPDKRAEDATSGKFSACFLRAHYPGARAPAKAARKERATPKRPAGPKRRKPGPSPRR